MLTPWILVLMLARGDAIHSRVVAQFTNENDCKRAAYIVEEAAKLRVSAAAVAVCFQVK